MSERFFTTYDPPVSADHAIHCPGEGADQSQAADCDINVILRRVGLGGEVVPRSDAVMAMYEDVSDVPGDYLEALNKVGAAQDHFDSLPAKIRNRFENDPLQLLVFLSDDAHRAEAIELGLVAPREGEGPVPVGTVPVPPVPPIPAP